MIGRNVNLRIAGWLVAGSLAAPLAIAPAPAGILRDVMVSAGAGFVVVLTGEIMTMPGLPKVPAAEAIDINEQGEVVGLF